jgi:fructoselysine 6-phosphate deglycase
MTNGTHLGPSEVAPIPYNYQASQEAAVAQWNEVDRFVAQIPDLRRVFLVGAGGSLVGLQAAQFVLDSESPIPSTAVNSDEFYYRASPTVDEHALVVVLSGTGNTPETVRAATWADSRGAAVAAVTLSEEGALAKALSTSFLAQTGEGNQVLLQLLALAVLKRAGVEVESKLAALRALPGSINAAIEDFEPQAAEIAAAMKDVPVTYVMASGPLMGPAGTFTACFLQEMQWMHAATLNADEFFQGPFEVFDKATKSIVFLGEDTTRPMGERVQRFLDEYSGETFYIDTRELTLPGIADDQRGYVAPLVYYTMMFRLAAHYAAVRGYALEGRRYMWQFAY